MGSTLSIAPFVLKYALYARRVFLFRSQLQKYQICIDEVRVESVTLRSRLGIAAFYFSTLPSNSFLTLCTQGGYLNSEVYWNSSNSYSILINSTFISSIKPLFRRILVVPTRPPRSMYTIFCYTQGSNSDGSVFEKFQNYYSS